jgi:hypothetical protein
MKVRAKLNMASFNGRQAVWAVFAMAARSFAIF